MLVAYGLLITEEMAACQPRLVNRFRVRDVADGDVNFIFLTDLHIGAPGHPDCDHYPATSRAVEAALARIKTLKPAPQFIVAAGDLVHWGYLPGNPGYVELKRVFEEAELDMPVLFALGNHDSRRGFYEGVLGRTEDVEAPYYHSQVIAGVHVIVLDTELPSQAGGSLDEAQWSWLAAELDANPDCPKLIVMHHAPALSEDDGVVPRFFTLHLADTARLQKLLFGKNVVGILAGHIHYDRFSLWHGIPVITGAGLAGGTPDVMLIGAMHKGVPGSSLGIGTIRPSGLTMTVAALPPADRPIETEQTYDELHALQERLDAEFIAKYGATPPGKVLAV